MATEFEFPDVGEGVTEGTLIKWLVEEGDAVEEDESLAEVETDKAVVEIPSPEDATILELHAAEGDDIKVGDVIVTLGSEDEETPSETATSDEEPVEEGEEAGAEAQATEDEEVELPEEDASTTEATESGGQQVLAAPSTRMLAREKDIDITGVDGSGPGGRITKADVKQYAEQQEAGEPAEPAQTAAQEENTTEESGGKALAAPATRRLAKEEGVDIDTIEGTGPDGRVTEEDVQRAAEGVEPAAEEPEVAEKPEKPEKTSVGVTGGLGTPHRFEPKEYDFEQYGDVEREDMSATRQAIGRNMERSKYTAPHVTSTDDADVTELWDVREKEKKVAEERGVHLTFLPFIVKATIAALREYPRVNASLDETTGELVKKNYYNMGIAVATEDGLMVPNIKDADQKSVLQIAEEMNDLADKARGHELGLDEMRGGTFTITNYGAIGGRYGTPILNYPEVAILGTGTIREEPVVRDHNIVIRRILPLSVTFDHRVIDGAYVARFMNTLIKHLEDPDLLLLDE